ncbi:MAG: hypothetical protein FJ125_14975 [Deltaproteobacteria bacterium]|nr:hypothetical protein [Deltaproteobacteria bacterium]
MSRAGTLLAPFATLLLLLAAAAPARAEPMECTPDTLRMAMSTGGTMPGELVRACLAIPPEEEMFSLAQYMISVHYQRRHDLAAAAVALSKAASMPPFATDPRILFRLSRYLIASGDLQGALVAKDRLLFNSGSLRREVRMAMLARLHRLLGYAFELQAEQAQEQGDEERFRQALVRARFYRVASEQLRSEGQGETVGFFTGAAPEAEQPVF